jgi:hypothetical protein
MVQHRLSARFALRVPMGVLLFLSLACFSNGNAIHITPAPPEPTYRAEFELAKREIDTWGYISGNSSPYPSTT